MFDALRQFFSESGFMPHGHCYLWRPGVLWLHLISDGLIVLAYFSIPFTLLYFVRKRHDLEFNWMFICFAVFIVACGATHLMEIWTVWHPTYWLSGGVKAVTAFASVPTAILLVKLVPQALRLPSPAALRQANEELRREIAERERAEREVLRVNESLEARVAERTRELETANASLLQEVRERKHVEQELRASEGRIRAILNSAPNAVIVIGADGRIREWSARAEAMFGYARADAIGLDLAETIIPAGYRQSHCRGLKHYLATGEGPIFERLIEVSAQHRDGSQFPVELSVGLLNSGETSSFCGFLTDITERKRAAEAIRSSQELLQAVIDNSTAIVYVKDLQGRYMLVNRRFEELFHHSRDWVIGKTDYEIFPKANADAYRKADQEVVAVGTAMQTEETVPHDDGLHTYVSVKCPLLDAAYTPYAICGISTDITDRQHAEARLRTQIARLHLLDQITRAIGQRQDLESVFRAVTRSLEDRLSLDFCCLCLYDADKEVLTVQSIGRKSQACADKLTLTRLMILDVETEGLSRCLQGHLVYEPDTALSQARFPQRLACCSLRSVVLAPLLMESKMFGILVAARQAADGFTSVDSEFLRQLSEHVALAVHQDQLYAALQNAYEDLRQSQQSVLQQERLSALGQMASGIAHDINNALSPVTLYVDSLAEREANLSDWAKRSLATIRRAIDDVSQTVARMREFYRAREPQTHLLAVSLNDMVRQVVELTRARWSDMAQERGVVIDLQMDLDAQLPRVMGAEGDIRDGLTNLIFNAVDAMPQGGKLTLKTHVVGGGNGTQAHRGVAISVGDSGVGMDEATRQRCLEPFFTTKGERGTGLGLAMVYGMAKRHNAELDIDSEPGHGTTMRLTFAMPESDPSASVQPNSATPTQSLRILLVDDDPLLLRSLADVLEADGHHVTMADGGQEGIDTFIEATQRGEPFSILITDLGMPYVDGRKVAAAARAASATTPILLLTGWGQRLIAEDELPPHVNRVLAKPPKLRELRQALAEFS